MAGYKPFKMRGNPMQRNFGIGSPMKQDKGEQMMMDDDGDVCPASQMQVSPAKKRKDVKLSKQQEELKKSAEDRGAKVKVKKDILGRTKLKVKEKEKERHFKDRPMTEQEIKDRGLDYEVKQGRYRKHYVNPKISKNRALESSEYQIEEETPESKAGKGKEYKTKTKYITTKDGHIIEKKRKSRRGGQKESTGGKFAVIDREAYKKVYRSKKMGHEDDPKSKEFRYGTDKEGLDYEKQSKTPTLPGGRTYHF